MVETTMDETETTVEGRSERSLPETIRALKRISRNYW